VTGNTVTGLLKVEFLWNSGLNPFATTFDIYIYIGNAGGNGRLWGFIGNTALAIFDVVGENVMASIQAFYPYSIATLPAAPIGELASGEINCIALALRLQCNDAVQFISFGGTLTASEGPSFILGQTSVQVAPMFDTNTRHDTLFGDSFQLSGIGCDPQDFFWVRSNHTYATFDPTPGLQRPNINRGQTIECSCVFPEEVVFISEVLYGTQDQDFIEIAYSLPVDDWYLQ
jgi:hypothetical protein